MAWSLIANIMGPQGPMGQRGLKGDKGQDASNAVPTNEAIAAALENEASVAHGAALMTAAKLVPARPAFSGDAPVDWTAPVTAVDATKLQENMAQASGGTPYAPFVMRVPDGTPGKLGEYYLYWSTDHATGAGSGIFMAYADSLDGPWTNVMIADLTIPAWMAGMPSTDTLANWRAAYHPNSTIYRDYGGSETSYRQCETPQVFPDLTGERRFVMYYQLVNADADQARYGNQSTFFAKSDDGITWVPGVKAAGLSSWDAKRAFASPVYLANGGHSGYAKVFDIGAQRVAYALSVGGQYSKQCMWLSNDGETFTADRQGFSYRSDLGGMEWAKITHLPTLFQWRGDVWGATQLKSESSGGGSPAFSQDLVGRMRPDLRTFMGSVTEAPFLPTCVIQGDSGELYGFAMDGTSTARTIQMRRLHP